MSTYTQILYQIVFSTKYRECTLKEANETALYKYIWGVLQKNNCHLYQINSMEDHIHILTHLHPSVALADLIKDIKLSTTEFFHKNGSLFPDFAGWQNGYGAFTYAIAQKDTVARYIKSQKEHHRSISFADEFKNLLEEHAIEFEEKYLL